MGTDTQLSMLDFDELRRTRHQLRDFLDIYHKRSVEDFAVPHAPGWFRLHPQDPPPTRTADRTTKGNLSTSATCLESLLSACPRGNDETKMASVFAKESLETGPWHSDGGAAIYCPTRTLSVVLRFAGRFEAPAEERVANFLSKIWLTVELSPDRHGIREAYSFNDTRIRAFPWQASAPSPGDDDRPAPASSPGYPPNALHTYWALRCVEEYCDQDLPLSAIAIPEPGIVTRVLLAWAWSRSVLTLQTALYGSGSPAFDGDQLGWALATRARWSPIRITELLKRGGGRFLKSDRSSLESPAGEDRDLVRAGLAAFFAVQSDDGRWPRFGPLFHYPASGNAHCYFFETLSELLRPALLPEASELRLFLRPHLRSLTKAWQFAQETATQLGSTGKGWCSGHHPQRTRPEAWATAAVYTFLQNLRKIVGIEADYAAREQLNAKRPRARHHGLNDLRMRGDTWQENPSDPNVAEMLGTMFVQPVNYLRSDRAHSDPDEEIFAKRQIGGFEVDWARSAILFGPPGTSKATLVRAIADAVGWEFVEIHASAFLAEGIDRIPAVADRIFARPQELHQTVILFDEIEELLRKRKAAHSNPFGRFLTTLMLPKLAALWKQRRVLFFVNTNLIQSADDAIKRSERFDALILVETPSYGSKKQQLDKQVTIGNPSSEEREMLALARYDQVPELVERIQSGLSLASSLQAMFPESQKRLRELAKMRSEARRDYRACRLVAVAGVEGQDFATTHSILRHVGHAQQLDYFILRAMQVPKTMLWNGRQFLHDGVGGFKE